MVVLSGHAGLWLGRQTQGRLGDGTLHRLQPGAGSESGCVADEYLVVRHRLWTWVEAVQAPIINGTSTPSLPSTSHHTSTAFRPCALHPRRRCSLAPPPLPARSRDLQSAPRFGLPASLNSRPSAPPAMSGFHPFKGRVSRHFGENVCTRFPCPPLSSLRFFLPQLPHRRPARFFPLRCRWHWRRQSPSLALIRTISVPCY